MEKEKERKSDFENAFNFSTLNSWHSANTNFARDSKTAYSNPGFMCIL